MTPEKCYRKNTYALLHCTHGNHRDACHLPHIYPYCPCCYYQLRAGWIGRMCHHCQAVDAHRPTAPTARSIWQPQ